MCGFVGIFDLVAGKSHELRKKILQMSGKIRHRGPDWSGVYESPRALLAHERLAIIDPLSGKQPLFSPDGQVVLAVNGEIYNHGELREQLKGDYAFQTKSDCEVIIPLYLKYGKEFLEKLYRVIRGNMHSPDLTTSFVAAEMGTSVRSLYSRLENLVSITPGNIIREYRLSYSAQLLSKTRLTVDEIIYRSGFSNRGTFFKNFSKRYGCTPRAWRRDHQ